MIVKGANKHKEIEKSIAKSGLQAIENEHNINIIAPTTEEFTDDFFDSAIAEDDCINFIWYDTSVLQKEDRLVYKHLSEKVYYIKSDSWIKFIDDIILIIRNRNEQKVKAETKDVCIIYNELDTEAAEQTTSMLSEVVDTVSISFGSSGNFSEKIEEWAANVNNIVLLGFENEEWAHSLLPEIWKIIGGESSKIKLVCALIQKPASELNFSNLSYLISEKELMPIEIKMNLKIE